MAQIFSNHRLMTLGISVTLAVFLLVLTVSSNQAAPSIFDWDVNSWPTGSLSQTYTGIGSPATVFTYTFSGDTNRFISNSPETNHSINGGTSPPQESLYIVTNYLTNTESVTLTIELSQPSTNVSFSIFDVDRNRTEPGRIDAVLVYGFDSLNNPVTPNLTANNPACTAVVGNIAIGLCQVNDNQDGGNVLVTFGSEIQRVELNLRDSSDGSVTVNQNIALHDINFDPGTPTPTPTETMLPPTATPTATTEPPTATPTNTQPPPTDTPTATPIPPTATPTATPIPPTATPTATLLPPTATPSATPSGLYRLMYLPVITWEWES